MPVPEGVAPVRPPVAHRTLFAGVFLVAFATLLLEVSLTRVLSFTIWYHFAYVVLSTALLGFGASGTALAVWPSIGTARPRAVLAAAAAAAGLAAVGAFVFIALVPLHPMAILRDPVQLGVLIAYQLAVTVPFLFAGLVVGLALRDAAAYVDRLYFWDLLGAGLGCATAVAAMNLVSPPGAVVLAATVFLAAAAVLAEGRTARVLTLLALVAIAAGVGPAADAPFTPARSKEQSMLTALGWTPRHRDWSALYRTDVLAAPPARAGGPPCVSWGLSERGADRCDAPRLGISHDGTAGTGIHDLRAGSGLPMLADHILRFPYLVANPEPHVLVIGVGGGIDVVAARQLGAARVTGVELDPVAVRLLRGGLDDVVGDFFRGPDVELVVGEGRHFIEATDATFDLIQMTGVDTLAAEFSGAYVLAENYLYTAEAVDAYLDHLTPGGILSFALGNGDVDHPRSAGRMVVTAAHALRARGVTHPERHLAVVDSQNLYVSVMIGREPFTPADVAALADEAARLGFRPLHLPGRDGHPLYHALASASGGALEAVLERLQFRIDAITDDRPFFFAYFRWTDLLGLDPSHTAPQAVTALGQLVLLVLLVSLSALGAVLILGPLLVFRRRGLAARGRGTVGILLYFLAIGTGFMLFEISLIQQFVLFLGYPTYSLTTTLGALLVALGCGSFLSRRWVGRERVALPAAVALLAALTALYVFALPLVQDRFLAAPLALRVVLAVTTLAPLGLVMGIFFPLGIRRAALLHEDLVPWAWGVNGCASVAAAVLAVVLAMTWGLRLVWLLSLAIYAGGTLAFLLLAPAPERAQTGPSAAT